ncbi:MAG: response regulator transcription factor [Candidatus Omnitrophota bacterium]
MREDKLIIVVDDEKDMIETLSEYFTRQGFRVKGASDSVRLFSLLDKNKPDLIILDLTLPGMHGFDICRRLREDIRFSDIPIIILSAKGGEDDKVSGLDIGADDYIVKPFSMKELSSRINAVFRRNDPLGREKLITVGEILEIDREKYEVRLKGKPVDLTPSEFKILVCLTSRKNTAFSRDRILDFLWGEEKIVVARTIDVHIRHLREKLGEAEKFIKNVRGVGYKIED